MPSFGKRIDGPAGRRGDKREVVALTASALTLQGSESVLVEDVCPTGARKPRHPFGGSPNGKCIMPPHQP